MMIAAAHLRPGDLLATGQTLGRVEPRSMAQGWTYVRDANDLDPWAATTLPPYDGPLVCPNPTGAAARVWPDGLLVEVVSRPVPYSMTRSSVDDPWEVA